ncbi:MAG: ABC transporter ATP-binding protein [Leptospira sp.]|nr:ABC transporter ATP-binding protein [Leptospira sp.]
MGMIQLSNLTKEYSGFSKPIHRIIAGLSFGYFGIDTHFLALDNINLTVKSGESLGIIGKNGAGKSTLLKLIAGVTKAEKGILNVSGSIRALLELSVGFNSELSGEENIYYNGLVWGYNPKQIKSLMDEIFEFANLQEFRNVPLKNYSSGMAMRLGFSLATAVRPDILIVDEALAVGDAQFQQKCLKRFENFLKAGSIVLFVSHDLSLVSHFCSRVILLERGKLLFDGETKKGIESYMLLLGNSEMSSDKQLDKSKFGNYITSLDVSLKKSGQKLNNLTFVNDSIELEILFRAAEVMDLLTVGFHIDDEKGIRIFGTNTNLLGSPQLTVAKNDLVRVSFSFPVQFKEGKYSISIALHKGASHVEGSYLWMESIYNFEVERVNLPRSVGIVYLPVSVESQILS